jgi:hypothetical protein
MSYKSISLFYCPDVGLCRLLVSSSETPRFVKPLGSKPVRVIRTVPLDNVLLYRDKLYSLLGIDQDSTEWVDAAKLVPAAYYLAQINTGATIEKYPLNAAEEEQARRQLHSMAQSALSDKPSQAHLFGFVLRGMVMGDAPIRTCQYRGTYC